MDGWGVLFGETGEGRGLGMILRDCGIAGLGFILAFLFFTVVFSRVRKEWELGGGGEGDGLVGCIVELGVEWK